ncbi:unnamed protein product [Effrenium voratum]|nr:unnamed protein product [Effrenium voratum]
MYPAKHTTTQEPILIHGSLIQLGQVLITRPVRNKLPDVAPIDTCTIKLAVYQDQWPGQWSTFGDGPMKQVMLSFPVMTLCRSAGCGDTCPKFHPPVDEDHITNVILDIWGRQWVSAQGARVPREKANCWTALVRIPKIAFNNLINLSGSDGLFIDPRDSTGRYPDDQFGVVWLPGATLTSILHKHRTTEGSTSIARLNDRFGLRFPTDRLPQAHQALRPDEPYLQIKVVDIYKVFPLPHGTQRQGLAKSLAAWKWKAKPLQPCKGDQHGIGWEVGAETPPPSDILQGAHGDVLVTKLRSLKPETASPALVAFDRTQKYLHSHHEPVKATHDPWQAGQDPWSQWFHQHPAEGQATSSKPAADRLQQAEERIKADVTASLQKQLDQWQPPNSWDEDQTMADDTHKFESRFQHLEPSVAELRQQNYKFEQWFGEAAEANAATNHQINAIAKEVHTQQAELSNLNKSVSDHNAEIRREMSAGFSNIEALLSKKHRTD